MEYFVHQRYDYGVGNFINCTPTIKTLATHFKCKVPVLFDSPHVGDMFKECEFIENINKNQTKNKKKILSSDMVNQKISDWEHQHQMVCEKLDINPAGIPHTYVDTNSKPEEIPKRPYCVIVRGVAPGGAPFWIPKKDPGDEIYKKIIEDIEDKYQVVFIGSSSDYKFFIKRMKNWVSNPIIILNDIRKSLGALSHSDLIISNDTGMYHAAGALNKKIFVLWKDTNFNKNKSPGKKCIFSHKKTWWEDYKKNDR